MEQAGLKVARDLQARRKAGPTPIDLLKNKEIQLVINTPAGQNPRADEVKIRTTAVYTGTPIMTTLSGAKAAALGIAALKKNGYAREDRAGVSLTQPAARGAPPFRLLGDPVVALEDRDVQRMQERCPRDVLHQLESRPCEIAFHFCKRRRVFVGLLSTQRST